MRHVSDVLAAGCGGVEREVIESTLASNTRRDGVRGWRTAMVAETHEQDVNGCRHAGKIQSVGVNRRNRRLFVTTKTIERHLQKAYAKLGVSRRYALTEALGEQ